MQDLLDWIERGPDDVDKVWGHVGSRNDEGEWESFAYEVLDAHGDQHQTLIDKDDLNGMDWQDFFDMIEDWADEHDVDHENSYGESE